MAKYKPVVLTILDGWGISEKKQGNAILSAETKNMDNYLANYPNTILETSGEAVGLPAGQMGNSEVGHLNIGAGRIVYQDLTRISKAIKDGDFFENPELIKAYKNCCKESGKSLHLMGLLSDGGVHSHIEHVFALIEMAKKMEVENLYVHCFLDGRDVPPKSALKYINSLEEKLKEIGIGQIATISGRYYAMDRDKRWDRVEKAYRAMAMGEGQRASSAKEAVENSYAQGITDEFVQPTVIIKGNNPAATIKEGDTLIFFNFRGDRAREITRAFVDKDFDAFERPTGWLNLKYLCMTEYDATIEAPVAFPPERFVNTLGEVLAKNKMKQLRIAETEKYAHVTFFFNGGEEEPNPGEERILIPSSKVATYDLQPEMSAQELTKTVINEINKDIYDVIIINYANPDMVGHTGNFEAAVKAVEVVDECIKKVADAVLEKQGVIIITSDHGNAEEMVEEEKGTPHTAHTSSPVPVIILGLREEKTLRDGGSLRDLAPTMLELLEIEKPKEMTGQSLID
ncbi:2,3-bisphosphoglycerate-independent phosphoglycerate mutase [Desulfitibacter alkalitolerans]|uniref:2,3-bisphosphoglycerate-independent phosphoglycerate mutase n=1 Tax=Desulfitibacter alkalitolerans TaxID=264641 RepID=UPI000480D0F1|nr:2,3-bisphosphoglycerate-independent phosphoglycerate mutase [Desulfitibacter alkalitolerans]